MLEDRLSRREAAVAFATEMNQPGTSEPRVFAICGGWGTGKTFFAEMALQHVKGAKIRIESWTLGSHSAVINELLAQLSAHLAPESKERQRRMVINLLKNMMSVTEFIVPVIGMPAIGAILKYSKGLLDNSKMIESRQESEVQLRKLCDSIKEPIWVVIDDIDRMSPSDIRECFRIISCYQRLSNIHFLMIYDHEYVLGCFQENERSSQEEFLEKIIDYRELLPPIESSEILERFFEGMKSCFQENFTRPSIESDFEHAWKTIVIGTLHTYRQIEQIERMIERRKKACTVNSEIYGNPTDLALLSILQVRYPKLFELLMALDVHGRSRIEYESVFLLNYHNEPPRAFVRFKEIVSKLKPHEADAIYMIFETLYPEMNWKDGSLEDVRLRDSYSCKRFRDKRWRDVYRRRALSKVWLTEGEWSIINSDALGGLFDLNKILGLESTEEATIIKSCIFSKMEEWEYDTTLKCVNTVFERICEVTKSPASWPNYNLFKLHLEFIVDALVRIPIAALEDNHIVSKLSENSLVVVYLGYYWRFGGAGVPGRGHLDLVLPRLKEVKKVLKAKLEEKTLYDDGGWLNFAWKKLSAFDGTEAQLSEWMVDDDLFIMFLEKVFVHQHESGSEELVSVHRLDDLFVKRIVEFDGELNAEASVIQEEYKKAYDRAKSKSLGDDYWHRENPERF